jgi:hypothetical protein
MRVFRGRQSVQSLGNVHELVTANYSGDLQVFPEGNCPMAIKLLFPMPRLFSHFSDWVMGWTTRVWFPAGTVILSLCHGIQTGSWSHPASYPIRIRGSFLLSGVKCPWRGADHSSPSSVNVKTAWSYTSSWCGTTLSLILKSFLCIDSHIYIFGSLLIKPFCSPACVWKQNYQSPGRHCCL